MRFLLASVLALSLAIPSIAGNTPEDLVNELIAALNVRDPSLLRQIFDDFTSPTLCNDFDFMLFQTLADVGNNPHISLQNLIESHAYLIAKPQAVDKVDQSSMVIFGLHWSYVATSANGSQVSNELDLVVTWGVEWTHAGWKVVLQKSALLRDVLPCA